METWRILDIINWGKEYLAKNHVSQPRLSMEWILSKVLSVKRLDLYLQFERQLNREELAQVKELIRKRVRHTPLQYLLGQWDFYGLPFCLNEHVFIPRPETETLVQSVLNVLGKDGISKPTDGLDLGTGSGNIAISLAVHLPNSRGIAVDLSLEALNQARCNADRNGVSDRIEFRPGCWFEALRKDPRELFDWIVSNPPYVSQAQWAALPQEVRLYEPRIALWGGADGTDSYEMILRDAPGYLKPGGWLALEIGEGQCERVRSILEKCAMLRFFEAIKDSNGVQRVVLVRRD